MKPKFSIITICLNNEKGLKDTLKSEIIQTYKNYEIIVIDGGSKDNTMNVINEFSCYITYWCSEPDNGIYNAMNKGVSHSNGEYCIFMNSGDKFYSDTTLFEISKYNDDIICGKVVRADSKKEHGFNKQQITMLDLFRDSLEHQSTFIKRFLFSSIIYDEKYELLADRKFCIQCLIQNNCSFRNTDVIVAYYDTNGISSTQHEKFKKEKDTLLKELLTYRIYLDYKRFEYIDDTLIENFNIISKTYRIKRICIFTINLFCKIKKIWNNL